MRILKKQKLESMESHRFIKYLKYALGEIILVVLGILLALQINNWNEQRKTRVKEKVFLNEILSDLNTNKNYAKNNIEKEFNLGRDSIVKTFSEVINHLENRMPINKKLLRSFFKIHQLPWMNYKLSGYETLKSAGMDIILVDSLRSNLGKYYTVTVKSMQNVNHELRDDFYNYILKFPRTLFKTHKNESNIYIQTPFNYELLLKNNEYIESLKMFKSIYSIDLSMTKWYLEETQELIDLINKYLIRNTNSSD